MMKIQKFTPYEDGTSYSAACRSAGAAALTSASTCTSNLAKFLRKSSRSSCAFLS